MDIVVLGFDHTTAPIELRERLACSLRQIPRLLRAAQEIVQESVLLSTCNRTEFYAVCSDDGDESDIKTKLLHLISEHREIPLAELSAHSYYFTNEHAIAHLFGVACGLYSLVPGEPQIQGQVADALEIAQGGGFAGPVTSALFRAALVTGKRARSETGISRNAVSVSHVAVQLARQLFPKLNEASVLLLGSGQMSELAARNLYDNGAQRLVIMNRTSAHATELAERFGATSRSFDELAEALIEADVVISSTRSPRSLLTPELMYSVMYQRKERSLLVIDIALPRDVDPQVANIAGVHLYNMDDLQTVVSEGIRLRTQEVVLVHAIIREEVHSFERWLNSLSVVDTISDLRKHMETLRQQELARIMRQLAPSLSEREAAAVQAFTTRLMNKMLHTPMLRLKEAAADGQGHIYAEALRYLFALEEDVYEEDSHRNAGQQAGDDTDQLGSRAIAAILAESGDNY